MNAQDWPQIKHYLLELTEQGDPAPVWAQIREKHPQLIPELTRLVQAQLNLGDFLENAPTHEDLVRKDIQETLGSGFEGWKPIARGGSGAVYQVQQTQPVPRSVAVKVLEGRFLQETVRRRFQMEREALASLNHPNICTIYSAGETRNGNLFLIMEWIDGIPLNSFCEQHQFNLDQRLALMDQVIRAIQFAHQNGILHRDLKPSNILVSGPAGEPQVKVIDFGIAIRLEPQSEGLTQEHGMFPGTLPFIPPERLKNPTAPPNTLTDVYALGVLLYELSCGFLPFEGANPFELAQKVIHDDPNRPSKRFRQSANRTWRKRLETDLDWIVMKALSRDQNQRYQTAAELNLDLQRFRRGQAISAHPPEWSYLIKKFISRHRSAVFAGTTILAILVFAVLALLQMYRRSEQARLHSEQEAKRAQAISEFLNDMLAAPDPKELGEDAKVIDFLDRSSQEVESRFSADPKVLAQVSTTLGDTYLELGRFDKAEPHYQRALAIHPENSTEKIRLLNKLGRHAIHTLDYSKAETYLTRGLELANQNLPPGNGLVLALRYNLAILHEETGSVQQAFSELVALKPIIAQLGDDDLSLKFACLSSLARVRADRGELAQAEVDLREVLKLQEKHLGPHHPETLATLFDLGKVLRNQEKFPEAELIQKREWELSCEVMGENHPETLISLEGFVRTLIVQNKFEQAQPLAEKSYHAFLEVFGPDHDFTAFAIIDQAEIKAAFNQPAEAEALFRQGLALAKTMDYQEKTHFTRFCERYIAFLSQQGRTQEAEKMRVHKCE